MLNKIFCIIGSQRKIEIIKLQFLIIISSIFELIGVTSIIPFMSIVNKNYTINNNNFISDFALLLHIDNYRDLVIFSGFFILFLMVFSSFCSIFTLKVLSFKANRMGVDLSNEFFLSYLKKNWIEHLSYRSTRIINVTTIYTNSLVNGVLLPLLNLNSKIILVILFITMLLFVSPVVTILSVVLFLVIYAVIFLFLKDRLKSNSIIISNVYSNRLKVLNETTCSIKDVVLKKLDKEFYSEFNEAIKPLPTAMANNGVYSSAPRYMVEMIAYVGVIVTILILFIFQTQSIENVISLLFLFSLSALKLLPAVQQIYVAISTIRGNFATVDILYKELDDFTLNKSTSNNDVKCKGFKKLLVNNISFTYPNKKEKSVSDVSFSLISGQSIAFVGPSGSGKSTLIDLIIGLLEPQGGKISVMTQDSNNLKPSQISSLIGYVPQSINILDRTVAENVAFGISHDQIDYDKVKYALKVSQCDFVDKLDNGLNTVLGERGIELSGGQRQRIAIARSMYNIPEILVFDEATSALDGQTEKAIVEIINELPKNVTKIMIAHRLTTVKECDRIYFLEKGEIVDHGTYDELYSRNKKFKMMAN